MGFIADMRNEPGNDRDTELLRAELFSIEQLKRHAVVLAGQHQIDPSQGPHKFLPRLAGNERVTTRRRDMVWFMPAVLALGLLPGPVFAESNCPGIHVKILNIKNSTGTVACALFDASAGFPTEYLRMATNVMVIKIRKDQARCDFEDIPQGNYAMAVVHDENMNGKLDTNWLGVPMEGYGFSNDAKGTLGAPSFSAASFPYNGQNLELTMTLNY